MDVDEAAVAIEWPSYLPPGDAVAIAAAHGVIVSKMTLANWRTKGRVNGAPVPVFYKLRGGAIAYPRDEFVRWAIEERGPAVTRTAELPTARLRDLAPAS